MSERLEGLLTVAEAADRAGVSCTTIRRWIARAEGLEVARAGPPGPAGVVLVSSEALARFRRPRRGWVPGRPRRRVVTAT